MRTRFLALDGLRGVAALAVASFHYKDNWPGYLAVDLFFVLSGFVIAYAYIFAVEKQSFGNFTIQRLARLYPLHIFGLFTFLAAYLITKESLPRYPDGTVFTFIQNITLTNNVGLNPQSLTYNYSSWSISVEFWINLVFFLLVSRRTRTIGLLLCGLVCFVPLIRFVSHLDATHKNILWVVNTGLLRGVASFALGIISYRIYEYIVRNTSRWMNDVKIITLYEISLALLLVAVLFIRVEKQSYTDFITPFLFTVFIPLLALEKGGLSMLIKKFAWLGDISYSVYLNHLTVLLLIGLLPSDDLGPLIFVSYIGVLIVYSALTYRFVEIPARKKFKSYLMKKF